MRELQEIHGHVDHAIVFVQHYHSAGAHYGANLGKRLVVHVDVYHVGRDAAARGSAGLDCLELLVALDSAADVVNDLFK